MKKLGIGCLAAIGFLFIVGVAGALIVGKSSTSQPSTPASTQSSDTTKQVVNPPETEVSKEYVLVIELSGNANKSSDTFTLTGGKVRLSYDFQGNTAIVGGIYVLTEGTDLQTEGGIPEVMVSQAGSDSTILRKAAGDYYLQVNAANATWTAKLEEER